jgi:hypothetical protein
MLLNVFHLQPNPLGAALAAVATTTAVATGASSTEDSTLPLPSDSAARELLLVQRELIASLRTDPELSSYNLDKFIEELTKGGVTKDQCKLVLNSLSRFVSKKKIPDCGLLPSLPLETLQPALIELVKGRARVVRASTMLPATTPVSSVASPVEKSATTTTYVSPVVSFNAYCASMRACPQTGEKGVSTTQPPCFINDEQLQCFTFAIANDELTHRHRTHSPYNLPELLRGFEKLISLDLTPKEWKIAEGCIEYQIKRETMISIVLNRQKKDARSNTTINGLINIFELGRTGKISNYEALLEQLDEKLTEMQTEGTFKYTLQTGDTRPLPYNISPSIDGFFRLIETKKATEELALAFLTNVKSHCQENYIVEHDISSMIKFIVEMGKIEGDSEPTAFFLNTLFKSREKLADYKKSLDRHSGDEIRPELAYELCTTIRKLTHEGVSPEKIRDAFFAYIDATVSLDKISRASLPAEMGALIIKGLDLGAYLRVTSKYSQVRDTLPAEYEGLLKAQGNEDHFQTYMAATATYPSPIRESLLREFALLLNARANRAEIIHYMNSTRGITDPTEVTIVFDKAVELLKTKDGGSVTPSERVA